MKHTSSSSFFFFFAIGASSAVFGWLPFGGLPRFGFKEENAPAPFISNSADVAAAIPAPAPLTATETIGATADSSSTPSRPPSTVKPASVLHELSTHNKIVINHKPLIFVATSLKRVGCLTPSCILSLDGQFSSFPSIRISTKLLQLKENGYPRHTKRCIVRRTHSIKYSMDASYGNATNGPSAVFHRINVSDPYKRLGISREASEEEIQAARNFLIQTYGGHKPSVDAIESAHDKIIMQKFHERKRPKVNIKKKVRDVTESRYVQAVMSRFRTPSTKFILLTSVAFIALGVLTLLFPTEEGPTVQVAMSVIVTIYFIYSRLKSKIRALLYGAGAFIFSWVVGTFLMVSVIPPILNGPRSLEVTTALITYVLLWVFSTYLK
ncbi:hypothetical protein Nepgr_026407 [Nepenthes gracilis]|uniref:Protein CHAPERONE-LIKE PROTEIN OF POR1, chloroplastic n=1 Tax=Nepenthes gracilis TaxID=150966 RepID=A0AAD3T8D8_NEPGR|nr:hypothetical protein Nepgr_026407 [Nepenthes gracilis]